MTVVQMRKLKQEFGLSYEMIAEGTGIPYSTVSKVMMGVTKSPRRDTVARLTIYFERLQKMEQEPGSTAAPEPLQMTFAVRETLPEDHHTELIDGILYDMSSPTYNHQDLLLLISDQLRDCIRHSEKSCRVYIAPTDVVLCETDPATVVIPDIFIICDKSQMRNGKCYGGPELIVEVLSPSTRRKDLTLKLKKYTDAGVNEYWIVDPDRREVIVWDLEACRDENCSSDLEYLYDFSQQVPVLMSGRKCSVDFAAIQKDIDDFFG